MTADKERIVKQLQQIEDYLFNGVRDVAAVRSSGQTLQILNVAYDNLKEALMALEAVLDDEWWG